MPVELAATTRMALRNVPDTIARATRLSALLLHGESVGEEEERVAAFAAARTHQEMCGRQTLARHMLAITDASQLLPLNRAMVLKF